MPATLNARPRLTPSPSAPVATRTEHHLSLPELVDLVGEVAAEPASWLPHLELPRGTDRWWSLLSGDDLVEVWLLSWLPGQATELHDHGDSSAAFTVVRGELAEVRIDPAGRREDLSWQPGGSTWIAPGVVHDVTGAGVGPAVSIHAYSPPLSRMTYYEPGPDGALHATHSVATHEPEQDHG